MKTRIAALAIAFVLAALLLAACKQEYSASQINALNSQQNANYSSSTSTPQLSPLQQSIQDARNLLQNDESLENYLALANVYGDADLRLNQRNTLENAFRIFGDELALDSLQTIVVNSAEEKTAIAENLQQLAQYLATPEGAVPAAEMMTDASFHSTMMPVLLRGSRRYYSENSSGTLHLQVGYASLAGGQPCSTATFTTANGAVTMLIVKEGSIQLLNLQLENGQYSGAFASKLADANNGYLLIDTGTLANGALAGDYTSNVYISDAEQNSALALFSLPDDTDATQYTGNFDENGITTVPVPPRGLGEGQIAYAYSDANPANYLYYTPAEGTDLEEYVFGSEFLGLPEYPVFTTYTPQDVQIPDDENTEDIQAPATISSQDIRVFNGNIEWFNGEEWVPMGDAQTYFESDPYYTSPVDTAGEDDENDTLTQGERIGLGNVPAVARPRPTQQQQETPPATGGEVAPPAPPPESQAPPPAESQPPDEGSDGQDIWSPDIL